MLFQIETLDGIRDGQITLAFRRWQRPAAKAGGTQVTKIGVLAIDAVDPVDEGDLTVRDAKRAGFASLDELRTNLAKYGDGQIYRIRFSLAGPDPRIALRQQAKLTKEEIEKLVARLDRLDRSAPAGPWTRKALHLIGTQPAVSARDLAREAGYERAWFKLQVRKLKSMGLTESLNPGYRLSPRGLALWKRLARG